MLASSRRNSFQKMDFNLSMFSRSRSYCPFGRKQSDFSLTLAVPLYLMYLSASTLESISETEALLILTNLGGRRIERTKEQNIPRCRECSGSENYYYKPILAFKSASPHPISFYPLLFSSLANSVWFKLLIATRPLQDSYPLSVFLCSSPLTRYI